MLSVRTPGGGGHGDPVRAAGGAVAADVAAGLVSPAHARDAYGVVLAVSGSTRRRRGAAGERRAGAGPRGRSTSARRRDAHERRWPSELQDALHRAAHEPAGAVSRVRPPHALFAGHGADGPRTGDGGRSDPSLGGARRVVRPVGGPGREPVKNLAGKVAVVTGAASGIGLALAERFAAEGMKVVMADIEAGRARDRGGGGAAEGSARPGHAGRRLAGPTTWSGWPARPTPPSAPRTCSATTRGSAVIGAVHEHTLADWQWVINVNLWGVIHGVRGVPAPHAGRGRRGAHRQHRVDGRAHHRRRSCRCTT